MQRQTPLLAKMEATEGSLAGQGEGAAGSQAPGFAAGLVISNVKAAPKVPPARIGRLPKAPPPTSGMAPPPPAGLLVKKEVGPPPPHMAKAGPAASSGSAPVSPEELQQQSLSSQVRTLFEEPLPADDGTTSLAHSKLSDLLAHRVKSQKRRPGFFVHKSRMSTT